MRIGKPILLISTPIGLAIGLEEAYRLAGGLVVLLGALIGMFGIAILAVVQVVRRESQDGASQRGDRQ